jgi:hypothetical protein
VLNVSCVVTTQAGFYAQNSQKWMWKARFFGTESAILATSKRISRSNHAQKQAE